MAVGQFAPNPVLNLIPAGSVGPVPALAPSLTYEDLNVANGGVARDTNIGTSYTVVYSKTTSGLFFGFNCGLETPDTWWFRLTIDSNEIFMGTTGIYTSDMEGGNLYGIDKAGGNTRPYVLGFSREQNAIRWNPPSGYPISFTTNVTIRVKNDTSKKFRGGFAVRS